MTPAERERELRQRFDTLRMAAPNPRDYRTWNDFYAAQAEHEQSLAALETQIDAVVEEALR